MSSIFKTKTVSDHKVKVMRIEQEKKPIKGEDWFSIKFPNILLLALKNSGKTMTISNILERCAGKATKFIFISSTIDKDPTWKKIVERWSKDHDVETFYDIIDDDGVNVIQQFNSAHAPKDDDIDDEEPLSENKEKQIGGVKGARTTAIIGPVKQTNEKNNKDNLETHKLDIKPRNSKYIIPKYIIVMDDLSESMRDKAVTKLLKTNRHPEAMVIISTQDLNDLKPGALKQLDYVLVFDRMSKEKMEEMYKKLKFNIDFKDFYDMYMDATKTKYNFFYIGRSTSEEDYRINFDREFVLE